MLALGNGSIELILVFKLLSLIAFLATFVELPDPISI